MRGAGSAAAAFAGAAGAAGAAPRCCARTGGSAKSAAATIVVTIETRFIVISLRTVVLSTRSACARSFLGSEHAVRLSGGGGERLQHSRVLRHVPRAESLD